MSGEHTWQPLLLRTDIFLQNFLMGTASLIRRVDPSDRTSAESTLLNNPLYGTANTLHAQQAKACQRGDGSI